MSEQPASDRPARRWSVARRLAPLGLGVAVVALLGHHATQAQPASEKPKPAEPPAAEGIVPAKFDHAQHAKLHEEKAEITNPVVSEDNCASCHPTDAQGELGSPAKNGHKPCLDAGCHVRDFLSVGPSVRGNKSPESQERYRKAAAFCLGCHASVDNEAPNNFVKAEPDNTYKNNASPNYRMDMTHFDHTQKEKCRSCHVVNNETFALELDAPGHAQCATCHSDDGYASPMTECAECHKLAETVEAPTWKQRRRSDVRSCGSEGHAALAEKRKRSTDKTPCFKHETKQHRYRDGGAIIQCSECHFMIGNKRRWGKRSYAKIPDIQKNPIIHNDRDAAHNSCGGSRVCHRKDVDDSRGTSRCRLCHSGKLIDSGLF